MPGIETASHLTVVFAPGYVERHGQTAGPTVASVVTVASVAEQRLSWHLYVIVVSVTRKDELVPTGVAAKQIGVHRGTLVRWWQQGLVEPELVTPGGQARWDVERLKRQLRNGRRSED